MGKLPVVPELVAIDLPGGPAFLDALLRIWDEGNAALPVDQRLPPAGRRRLLDALRPAAVVDGAGTTALENSVPVEAGDALVMATSGTTGEPKGVVLTRSAVEASAQATSSRLGVSPGHRWLACLPLNHVGGMSVVTRSVVTGVPVDILPGWSEAAVRRLSGPDVFVSLVSTALRRTPAELFHTVVLGGSAPPSGLPANVVTTYGLTETGSGVVYDGIPLDGVSVDLTADGEIRLRAPMLLRAYRDGTVPLDDDGWFRTGDGGSFDDKGRLVVHGRRAEMIITGGENVWPAPVEAVLRSHPAVADVAVAGRPDEEWGQRVVAWVVPADTSAAPSLGELRDWVAERLPRYCAPRQLVVTTTFPRTSIGKVRKDLLESPPV